MEKRILLSFALSFIVLVIFYQFLSPPSTAPQESVVSEAPSPEPETGVGEEGVPVPVEETGGGIVGGTAQGTVQAESSASPAAGRIEAASPEVVTVASDVYSVRMSNRGAVLESIRLLDYSGAEGETLELVDGSIDAAVGWPLEMVTGDPDIDQWLRESLWAVSQSGRRVRMDLAGDGARAFKELVVDETGYRFGLTAGVERDGQALPFALVWQGSFGDQSTEYTVGEVNVVYREAGAFDRLNVGKIEDADPLLPTEYIGLEDRYFLAMFLGSTPTTPVLRTLSVPVDGDEEPVPLPRIEFGYEGGLDVYVGPKQSDHLRDVDPALVSVIDYGFFGIIAAPLLSVLLWIQAYVGNFGWSIVLMTLLVNAALFPLRLKQQLSMLGMQKIQPQMRTLQDKYKKLKPNDPRRQEVQSEMMGLYQKHGVNPLGGCLPLVLQMPIFFAIFRLLRSAIELRQAPWVFWIDDLSVHDPLFILPVLMGVSMLLTQRLTPTTMDPAQARIMMFMPVMFTVFMIRVQSGLVLYWLTSNLVGVAQQIFINRYWAPRAGAGKDKRPNPVVELPVADSPPEAAASDEPPAKRRRRKR